MAASVLQSPFPEKPAALSGDHIDSHGAVADAKVKVRDASIYAGLTHCSVTGCNFFFNFGFRMRVTITQTKQAREFKF